MEIGNWKLNLDSSTYLINRLNDIVCHTLGGIFGYKVETDLMRTFPNIPDESVMTDHFTIVNQSLFWMQIEHKQHFYDSIESLFQLFEVMNYKCPCPLLIAHCSQTNGRTGTQQI